jgi:hypothetical protein
MVKKALKKTSKVLGGLGAAYILSDALGPKVTGVDPEVEAADREATRKRVEENRVDRPPAPANPPAASAPEPSVRTEPSEPPVMSLEEIAKLRAETARGLRERENQIDFREQASREPSILKKGGTVSASRRGDGIAQRGKTRGKMV